MNRVRLSRVFRKRTFNASTISSFTNGYDLGSSSISYKNIIDRSPDYNGLLQEEEYGLNINEKEFELGLIYVIIKFFKFTNFFNNFFLNLLTF